LNTKLSKNSTGFLAIVLFARTISKMILTSSDLYLDLKDEIILEDAKLKIFEADWS